MKKVLIDARESGTSTGRYIDKLIEYLIKINKQYEILILTKPNRIEYFQKFSNDVQIIESTYKEFTLGEQIGLKRQIEKIKPDLVHFGIVQQPILYKGKVVTTMHDLTTTRFNNPLKNKYLYTFKQYIYKWVNRIVALKSNYIIAISEYVKNDVAKFARINSRKIIVIYEAADKIPEHPIEINYLINQPFIMYVGRPQPHKNLYRLITAFSKLKKENSELKLILVGKKDALYSQLENWVNIQGIKNVYFTGFIEDSQLRWLYENCIAYVFPSLSEGFGLPGLEAMIHGAPVISSNATCLPEIYGDAALYFDPLNVNDMTISIKRVVTDIGLRKELVKKGYVQVAKYSWRKTAEQTISVYDSILNK